MPGKGGSWEAGRQAAEWRATVPCVHGCPKARWPVLELCAEALREVLRTLGWRQKSSGLGRNESEVRVGEGKGKEEGVGPQADC